jgi:hypothetical protein
MTGDTKYQIDSFNHAYARAAPPTLAEHFQGFQAGKFDKTSTNDERDALLRVTGHGLRVLEQLRGKSATAGKRSQALTGMFWPAKKKKKKT